MIIFFLVSRIGCPDSFFLGVRTLVSGFQIKGYDIVRTPQLPHTQPSRGQSTS